MRKQKPLMHDLWWVTGRLTSELSDILHALLDCMRHGYNGYAFKDLRVGCWSRSCRNAFYCMMKGTSVDVVARLALESYEGDAKAVLRIYGNTQGSFLYEGADGSETWELPQEFASFVISGGFGEATRVAEEFIKLMEG